MRVYPSAEAYRAFMGDHLTYGFHEPIAICHETEMLQDYDPPEECPVTWAQYQLEGMPGCHGMVVSHSSRIIPEMQHVGLGDHFHKERLALMRDSGASCGICTVREDNLIQRLLLHKNGWTQVHAFLNKQTKNRVQIWVKDI